MSAPTRGLRRPPGAVAVAAASPASAHAPASARAPLTPASRGAIIAAFAAVYIIWGSTYLGIRFAIETLPPFLMAGTRFMLAGVLLYLWTAWRESQRSSAPPGGLGTAAASAPAVAVDMRQQWLWATLVGGLLLFCGNGAVVWAEARVPSGIVSLLVAGTPIWMVLLDWLAPGGRRPGLIVAVGLALGVAGLVILVGPDAVAGDGAASTASDQIDLIGALVVLFGSLTWALGSILSRHAPRGLSALRTTAMQMLAGGTMQIIAGLALGEHTRFDLGDISLRSALAWAYLVVFGSLVGFTAYVWLLDRVSAARASTYAYVNPIVAVLLGWAFAGELITTRTLVAGAVIVAAVAAITIGRARPAVAA